MAEIGIMSSKEQIIIPVELRGKICEGEKLILKKATKFDAIKGRYRICKKN